MSNSSSPVADFVAAFSLVALDPSLQGVCLWGPRSERSDKYIEWLARHRGGPLVRLPAYASPRDVTLSGKGNNRRRDPIGKEAAAPLPFSLPPISLPERAQDGVLLVESADLLPTPTGAALRRALASMPRQRRPLLIARADAHPRTWPLLANECAFWLREPGIDTRTGIGSEPTNDPFATWPDPPPLIGISRQLYELLAKAVPFQSIVQRVPVFGAGPPPDRFVVRAAMGLAALDGAKGVSSRHVDRALQLVVHARQGTSPPGEHSKKTTPDQHPERATKSPPGPEGQATDTGLEHRSPRPQSTGEGFPGSDVKTDKGADEEAPGLREKQRAGVPGADAQDDRVRIVPPSDLFTALSVDAARGEGPKGMSPFSRRPRVRTSSRPGPPTGAVTRHRREQPLSVPATLHAAMPWQRLRQRQLGVPPRPSRAQNIPGTRNGTKTDQGPRLHVLPEDLRSRRRRPRPKTLYILAVDGSGSMAQHRMQLAKTAALGVLAGAYRERRYVALIDFRRAKATLLCPPGRSAAAIRRLIAALPSGGGTPLPAALALTRDVGRQWLNQHPDGHIRLVLFTDGKANVPLARPGAEDTPMTPRARRSAVQADVHQIGHQLHDMGVTIHLVDGDGWRTSPDLHSIARSLHATVLRIDRTYRRPGTTAPV